VFGGPEPVQRVQRVVVHADSGLSGAEYLVVRGAQHAQDMGGPVRSYKENIREQSLKAFGHRAEADLKESPEAAAHRIGQLLVGAGWKVRLQQRDTPSGVGWMVAAKAGAANKLGYIAAHSAIVLVCLGGLMDGELIVRAQMLFNGKTPFDGGGMIGRCARAAPLGRWQSDLSR
jgi:cytochrome c biogenesis protein